ncbi:unnamed protein product [Durusdinium trenchii]|uniref:Uncharacterized protein n=2 Tax=Durusdinium trenchii TaxID=1381693 RepID=A0ABP0NFE8_9DINO
MRLDPLGLKECSSWTDGGWFEKPGHPAFDGCWIHTPLNGCCLPEFEFLENHDKIKGEPAPVLYVGSGFDCHIRLPGTFPSRICRFMKHNSSWFLEALLPKYQIHLQGASLEVGQQEPLKDGDIINLHPPADDAVYVIHLDFAGSPKSGEDYPNKYPARFPCRSSLLDAPEAPEELRRLAWQTDQMRRRSENDQVRVADWSNFSQYVKQHYLKHGIECTSWKEQGRGRPWDAKPASFPARALPKWISELLDVEQPLVGLSHRALPFASALRASGYEERLQKPMSEPLCVEGDANLADAVEPERVLDQSLVVKEPPVEENPWLQMPIHAWLESIDDSLFMLQYCEQIVSNFDSLKQIHDIYFRDGSSIDAQFYKAAGITKLGHKRIIEKWFREKCSSEQAAGSCPKQLK